MSKVSGFLRQITLAKLLVLLSIFSIAIAALLILVLSGVVRDRAVHDLARNDARQTSKLVFESLYSAMRKGWNKEEIKEVVERLNQTMPGLAINVYRGEIVENQFGAMAGERAVIAADPELSKALREGKDELMVAEGGKSIRYLYPVQAQTECLVCHTQSHVGAVHGVIDITYPIDDLKVSFGYVINSIVGYTLLIMTLVFLILFFKLRYLVALPIADLVRLMQKITHGMDFSLRVDKRHWIAELHHLSDYFNRLLGTVQDYNNRLQELSVRDPLTNLYNRRKFEEFLDYEILRAARHTRPFSVIMIDIDNFKYINDTYGHPIGDMVIKELAILLTSNLRRGDVLARLGGDEFALILPETPAAMGLQAANKLHQALKGREFELPVGRIRVTASFSMVSYPEDGQTRESIYSSMDVVLYKAKRHGKDQVMTAETDQDRSMMEIFRQGDFLRNAMHEGRIESFLQPIVDVRSGKVVAFESLARIRDGERVYAAGEFIEVAEELGMAKELDQVVFRKALEHLGKLVREHSEAKMFFNLSARSFNDIEWMRSIPAMVQQRGITCDKIVLELTEREALPHLTQVKVTIDELRQSNIAFALDDFGSGFSSFLYLKYLAVDYVKIEGSFVRQIAVDDRDRIMVQHIHEMAHEFGLKTVAEFVEDEATSKMLAEIGVDYAQGYYYGRPAAPPED
ncbi:MAG: EAL domain-containing protein [Nitrosomonadales bacterium]|nr:EAL domain-containing protein [Nitrosomonadales bacterium]